MCDNAPCDGRSRAVREMANDGDAGIVRGLGAQLEEAPHEAGGVPGEDGQTGSAGAACRPGGPHCPDGRRGRPPYPPETILRGRCLQPFFSLGDRPARDILHDMPAARRFAGLSYGRPMPDETTMPDFRRLPELHVLGEAIFNAISRHLESKGFRLSKGTIVDATIVAAPRSTKNKERATDPEMHATQKGRRLYFGMKLRIGVDEETGLTHSLDATPANKSDVEMAGALPRGDEERGSGDAGYQKVGKRPENEVRQTTSGSSSTARLSDSTATPSMSWCSERGSRT